MTDITLWDAENAPNWKPPFGGIAVQCPDDLHLGATYDGKCFTQPEPKQAQPEVSAKVGPDGLTDDERATFKALAAKVAG